MGRIKYGYVFNLEQAVTDDIGVFGRWSWNDGKTEIMAFTDIDASLVDGHLDQGHQMGPARRRDRRSAARSTGCRATIAISSRPAASAR